MKNEVPVKLSDRLAAKVEAARAAREAQDQRSATKPKYPKADNCFVAMAKLTAVGVGLVIVANVLGPKPAQVAAPAAPTPQAEITQPEVNPEAERREALEREAAEALERIQTGTTASHEDTYRDFLARQQQRQADLEYCAKHRTDWSCTDGQYAGQY